MGGIFRPVRLSVGGACAGGFPVVYGLEKIFSVSSGRAGDGGGLGDDVRLDEGADRQRDVAGRYFRVPFRAGVCLYLVHFTEKAVRRFLA